MKRIKSLLPLLCVVILLFAHDQYLKLDSYFLEPDSEATIQLFNGTFDKSDNTIDRNRMQDASMVYNGVRKSIDSSKWSDRNNITYLDFETNATGTYVTGVSTKRREISMEAQRFNNYLEHDGVIDMLEERKKSNTLNDDAVESYSKHVKAIFQVGEDRSNDWKTALNYPIEFVPQENPYDKNTGDQIKIQLLLNGQPLKNQLVIADVAPTAEAHSHNGTEEHEHGAETHEHKEGDSKDHTHTGNQQIRTDENGMLLLDLVQDGIWYLRTIHMTTTQEEGLTHVSNWATLTFQITHSHDKERGDAHTHQHEESSSTLYIMIGLSILVIAGLFFYFNGKKPKSEV